MPKSEGSQEFPLGNGSEEGRLALWLEPDLLEWLARKCCCTPETPGQERANCARIRFLANCVLHKAGLKKAPGQVDDQDVI